MKATLQKKLLIWKQTIIKAIIDIKKETRNKNASKRTRHWLAAVNRQGLIRAGNKTKYLFILAARKLLRLLYDNKSIKI